MKKVKIKISDEVKGLNDINISENDIYKVVHFWYNFLEPEIFQNEHGQDLEEVLESLIEEYN